jgi:hypothetical protein
VSNRSGLSTINSRGIPKRNPPARVRKRHPWITVRTVGSARFDLVAFLCVRTLAAYYVGVPAMTTLLCNLDWNWLHLMVLFIPGIGGLCTLWGISASVAFLLMRRYRAFRRRKFVRCLCGFIVLMHIVEAGWFFAMVGMVIAAGGEAPKAWMCHSDVCWLRGR